MVCIRAGLLLSMAMTATFGCASVPKLKGATTGGGGDGTMTMPDLFRMTQAEA